MTRHERMVEALDALERKIEQRTVTLVRRVDPQCDDLDVAYVRQRILAILADAEGQPGHAEVTR